jgi:hypothetical protein
MELTMQTNINEYDNRASWIPPQNQPYTSRFVTSQDGEPQFALPQNLAPTQRPAGQKPKAKAPEKMPKARAMALANKFKRGFAIASIVGFGAFGGLVALHHVGTTATQSSSGSSSSNSSSSSSSQNSNSFLNQQGGNTNGTSSSSSNGSSTSSSSTSSSSSSTVSGTHTS